jgi:hypothetical protein
MNPKIVLAGTAVVVVLVLQQCQINQISHDNELIKEYIIETYKRGTST